MKPSMTRRQFSRASLATLGLALPFARLAARDRARRPNILVLVADDAGARHFGCYGNRRIKTPHIDRLAERGLACDNAILTTPQCSPSRISILTGRYPHETGAEDLHMPLPDGEPIVPGLLQEAGYYTGHMQKTHYGPHADAQFQWYDPELDKLGAFIDEAGERPFFMWVGFDDPHRPYQDNTIAEPHDPDTLELAPWLVDTPETRRDLARYYDEISRMDGVIGEMMATLAARGVEEETLVVFLSDNGAPFPREKGALTDAGVKTPLIFHWPGRVPAGERTAEVISVLDLVPTWLSLAGREPRETMRGYSLAPHLLRGESVGRDAAFSERNWHDTDEHLRSVRTRRYKLIHNAYIHLPFGSPADVSESPSWRALFERKQRGELTREQALLFQSPRPEIEFYDLERDPWEVNNLAGDPDYRDRLREHVKRLEAWREQTDDFPPSERRRRGHTDRVRGVFFSDEIPPMTDR